MRILIVDDDTFLLEQILLVLKKQRYSVDTAKNGEEALYKSFEYTYDAIILDIMMPKVDGFTVLKELRNAKINTPVILLTAKGDVQSKIKGLDIGADDYLAKPFSMDELLARLRAILRRFSSQAESILTIGGLKLDTVSRTVAINNKSVELTIKEFSILEFLLYNKNRVVSRFSLAEHVWGDEFDPFNMSNFMDVHIKNLRDKLAAAGCNNFIKTKRGIGYIIEEEI
ncbi:response regulator transcription factor [Deferribacteraceae bacterium V6Fe1]|nr:response regulator transcription factor [Deferribacteraceae bacterium V6Fe1]